MIFYKRLMDTCLPLLFCIAIDFTFKFYAIKLHGVQTFGFLHFTLQKNFGIILGGFQDVPILLRTVSLATLGILILLAFTFIQFIFLEQSVIARLGASLLVGGILGNVLDRILHGYVIDCFFLNVGSWSSPIFNLADLIQWMGYLFLIFAWLGSSLSPPSLRTRFWINPKFQKKYCVLVFLFTISPVFVLGIYSYTYLNTLLMAENMGARLPMLTAYFVGFMSVGFGLSLLALATSIVFSHRIAGPIAAMQLFLRRVKNGDRGELRLRESDELKELEAVAKEILQILKRPIK